MKSIKKELIFKSTFLNLRLLCGGGKTMIQSDMLAELGTKNYFSFSSF